MLGITFSVLFYQKEQVKAILRNIQDQISWSLWLKPTPLTLYYNRVGSKSISSYWFLLLALLALQAVSVALGDKYKCFLSKILHKKL